MEISLFGQKMRVELIVLCLIIGIFIGVNMFCSCAGGVKEGFQAASDLMGAAVDYHMGDGVKTSWDKSTTKPEPSPVKSLDSYTGGEVPLPAGQLYMFYNNKNSPDCCPAAYSSSTGCVCISPEQMNYLNTRGGNRSLGGDF